MAIETSDKDAVFLYDTVSGRPFNTEAFSSDEHAEHFLHWFLARYDRSNLADYHLVNNAVVEWQYECLGEDNEICWYGDS